MSSKPSDRDDFLNGIEESYDRIAEEYAVRIAEELKDKPLDRELLDRFAERMKGRGQIADLGCGPAHVGGYLYDRGVDAFGIDLAPRMLEQARKLNPAMLFREGNMLALDLPSNSLAGIVAFYAIVNLPPETLPRVFGEMHRVLQQGGLLFLAFHVGDEILKEEELWGHRLNMSFFLLRTPHIKRLLEDSGFLVEDVIEREPYPEVEYQSSRAYIFAAKEV